MALLYYTDFIIKCVVTYYYKVQKKKSNDKESFLDIIQTEYQSNSQKSSEEPRIVGKTIREKGEMGSVVG